MKNKVKCPKCGHIQDRQGYGIIYSFKEIFNTDIESEAFVKCENCKICFKQKENINKK